MVTTAVHEGIVPVGPSHRHWERYVDLGALCVGLAELPD